MSQLIPLANMHAGQQGKIALIEGGAQLKNKLQALGIVIGVQVTKISSQWLKGPQVIKHNSTEVAIGYGMAQRIIVDVEIS